MKPFDPRLAQGAAARAYLVLTVGLGALSAGLVVAQALLVARLLTPVVSGSASVADGGVTAPDQVWPFAALVAVVGLRGAVAWAQDRYALRAAARTVAELRSAVVAAWAARPPRSDVSREADVATLATRGLDALEPYLVRYLPQLVLTALLTPALVVVVWTLDWVSVLVVIVTLPLVPLFMVLVGRLTAGTSERRLATVQRLGAQVLDLVAGLPTLRAFGRAIGPGARVRELGDASRRATMGTLRVAFLSSMVLELLTTLSVAIVAVGVGLRLVEGAMPLEPAIAVLMLAPEVYLPLRRVGAEFHASTDGLAAADRAFAVLEDAEREDRADATRRPAPPLAGATLVLDDVTVRAGDRAVYAPAGLSARIPLGAGTPGSGRVVALRGPSGGGKSTAVLALLGLLRPDAGRVLVEPAAGGGDGAAGPVDLTDVDLESWWARLTWVPQRPSLPPGTVHDVVTATRAVGSPERDEAARRTGLDAVVRDLPRGWDTVVGLGGVGLSVGQRQRVALTAALLDDAAARPLVVLDEPTAHLDARGEQAVLDTVRAWRDAGRTVVVVAHRASLLALADQVVDVSSAPAPAVGVAAATIHATTPAAAIPTAPDTTSAPPEARHER
ncbi:thiol reductant ABC exporter subunit CydD [Antribacter sp. KLBMP9083]|uniref:Thiol reductant ABC exporter subunit CydD n=1 Tax=Antribacter soli TaxID=2910976 RepID=A0AA41U7J6_9MICO|nr:thiol reductant ABC exporter subunit CydD [Antribacter soli]MCF4121651.1 thiol reductant ABC exporter subunit CydD [Antribacter soli]